MIQPYVGEVRMFAGSFAPAGWMLCDGQLLSIAGNESLFRSIGALYGGDGVETFGLPDLRGRVLLHEGNGFGVGERGGEEEVALTVEQIPAHSHPFLASPGAADTRSPLPGNALAAAAGDAYNAVLDPVLLSPLAVTPTGETRPHPSLQPYVCVNFIISLFGSDPTLP